MTEQNDGGPDAMIQAAKSYRGAFRIFETRWRGGIGEK
jgi:hypothetical protein